MRELVQLCIRTQLFAAFKNFTFDKQYPIDEIEIKDPSKWNLISGSVKEMKYGFDVFGKNDKDPTSLIINEDISVEELAPTIFSIIRTREGITNTVIKNSLSPELNRDMVFKAGEGQGKSGSFFFFSHDRKFIIKTMNEEEYKTFQGMFRKYYKHILKNEFSLLARIYGIFTVYKEKITPVHLILMGNTVKLHGKGEGLKYIFDLKGSLINREWKMSKNHKPSSTLKDINLLELKKDYNLLKFTFDDKKLIMDMIKKDVELLCGAYIMDFSLLLAIEENQNFREHAGTLRKMTKTNSLGNRSIDSANSKSDISPKQKTTEGTISKNSPFKEFNDKRHMYLSSNAQYIYHIAIIDYLQYYNFDKKMEHLVKTILRGTKAEISAVCPKRYSKRYIDFMESQVFVVDRKTLSPSIDEQNIEEDQKELGNQK